ncbi:recombinase family protein [Caballeronia sp. EK]|nr:recombinase family protein [Caballeronia sp. EK]
MSQKISAEHLCRGAVVYVRQSTMSQVVEHTESQNRQYALAESARAIGFASVTTIDDDLGRSGSGSIERPGFQRLVASVCAGSVGAVFCLEASRLARNGRDWQSQRRNLHGIEDSLTTHLPTKKVPAQAGLQDEEDACEHRTIVERFAPWVTVAL